MSIFRKTANFLGLTRKKQETQSSKVNVENDRHDQAMRIWDDAIEAAPSMEDSPEKLAFIMSSFQSGFDLLQQQEALDNAHDLKQRLANGEINHDDYQQGMNDTLDRFVRHGGLGGINLD